MRLSCAIVSRILAALTAGEPVPAWAARHLDGCERCRAEAAEYSRLTRVVNESFAGEETLSLTWQELRTTLPARQSRSAVGIPVFATAAVAAVVAVICISLAMQAPRSMTNIAEGHAPQVHSVQVPRPHEIAKAPATPKQLIVPEIERPNVPKARLAEYKVVPLPAPRHAPSHRIQVKQPEPAVNVASANSTDGPRRLDSPSYKVVGAEEHVIDVIGVGSSADPSDSDTSYVIRTTESGDDHQVTLL